MTWLGVLENSIVGIVSGLISSLISYFAIDCFLKRKYEYKVELGKAYLYFKQIEPQIKSGSFDYNELNNRLIAYRILFGKNKKLSVLFHDVDITFCALIRNKKSGGGGFSSLNSQSYFDFINYLEEITNYQSAT